MNIIDIVKFDEKGLVSAIAQDIKSNEVLMLAYMNKDTLSETLTSGTMVYFSRSRNKRWRKGDTSGHYQRVHSIHVDCDGDALLFKVSQTDAACHEGYFSCFYRMLDNNTWKITHSKVVANNS